MWKIMLLILSISLALFCSPLKGKEVLDRVVRERMTKKGDSLIDYRVDQIDNSANTLSIFYITATVKAMGNTKEIKDTVRVWTTADGILTEETK
ncbi:MAG TPA: hypothetical protein VKR32_04980 [Puia sp.]|nr:hypothetical protein [Puia sp.]